ncbi:alpha/beta hydrolase [Solimonas sp. K1W22B-7]|uniref:alpha/beta hydrolase n=1 Tax=Solimonas sp. K1W22B-7 TaxID=2303331 RepID=UPI000E32EF2F|nr:alpha/beta hydrolase [Solimonas sp. K1W22B-7]AXQ27669.1 alpha/beta hydrolase [Solimonas sp. K1W22B-7]
MKIKILLSALALLLAGCATRIGATGAPAKMPETDVAYTVQKDMTYTPAGWPVALQADLWRPAVGGAKPAVLLVHGGGWTGGKRQHMDSIAKRLAGRGYVVMNISYRFAPQYRYPAQIEDAREALHWLRANHEALQVDPQRIAAWGYSAGAHLAALLGAADAVPADRVQAVVAGGIPADFRYYPKSPLIGKLMGTTLADDSAGWTAASPVTRVGRGSPPFFLYHGSWDTTVGDKNAHAMKVALDAAGVANELYILHGLGHIPAFFFDGGAVKAGIAFLDQRMP